MDRFSEVEGMASYEIVEIQDQFENTIDRVLAGEKVGVLRDGRLVAYLTRDDTRESTDG